MHRKFFVVNWNTGRYVIYKKCRNGHTCVCVSNHCNCYGKFRSILKLLTKYFAQYSLYIHTHVAERVNVSLLWNLWNRNINPSFAHRKYSRFEIKVYCYRPFVCQKGQIIALDIALNILIPCLTYLLFTGVCVYSSAWVGVYKLYTRE